MALTKKLRLHIENSGTKGEALHMTEERYAAAARRHRPLARHLDVTFGWDGDILEDALRTADIYLGIPKRRERLVERAPRLKWIHTPTAGIDGMLPLDWLPQHVVFTNNVGVHGAKAEEFLRMALTMLNTRLPQIIAQQRDHVWRQVFSPSLKGRTALIVGLGDLGGGAARAARQLGLKVLAVRRSGAPSRLADRVYRLAHIDRLLPRADFVVIAAPLTPETRNLLDRRRLDLLKPTAGVINIARARIVDYEALRAKLVDGSLGGAVLDVMSPEPLPADSPLWDTPNLIITPHISCDDPEYANLTLEHFFANLGRFVRGRPLKNVVDRELGY
jgi:phosphoglycerate dehydrogenase-like enzyme